MIPLEDQVCFGVRRGRLSPRKEERGCLPRRIIKRCILSCSAPASRPPACCGRPSRKPSRRPCGPTRRRWNWNLSVIAHAMPPPLSRGGLGSRMKVDLFAKGSPVRKDSPGRGRWHASAERGTAVERMRDGEGKAVSQEQRNTAIETLFVRVRVSLCFSFSSVGLALSGADAPAVPLFGFAIFPRPGEIFPKGGEPLAKPETLRGLPRPLTLGEVALRSNDGEGKDAENKARNLE